MNTHNLATHETKGSLESTKSPRMGRLTFGDLSLDLPVDDEHKANRKV